MDLSIVIVTYNSAGYIGACLDALPAACAALTAEVIVVDSASGDETRDLVAERAGVQLLPLESNAGFAAANNHGIRRARAEVVVLLNPDTLPAPGSLARLHAFLADHPRCAAVGPRLIDGQGRLQPSAGALPTLLGTFAHAAGLNDLLPRDEARRARIHGALGRLIPRTAGRLADHAGAARRCEVVWAAALAVRAGALHAVGLLDEGSFMYGEENELCARLAAAGWEVWFEPAAEVLHYGGASGSFSPRLAASFYRARLRYFARHGGRARGAAAPLSVSAGLALRPWVRLVERRSVSAAAAAARFSLSTLVAMSRAT